MPDPPVTDLALEDYTSVIGIAADTLGGSIHFNAVIRNFGFRNVKIPGPDSNDRLYWQALFDAAMQHKVDSPKELIKYIVDNGVSQEEMDKALSQVAERCMLRTVKKKYPDLYEITRSLLRADTVPGMRTAARDLREATVGIWCILTHPVLSASFIQISPDVHDPEQRRRQLADLAVNAVTAVDYLLTFLADPSGDTEEFKLGPDQVTDEGPAVRLIQRRLDARSTAVKVAVRFLDGLYRDVAFLS
jgi:hypothetical protein